MMEYLAGALLLVWAGCSSGSGQLQAVYTGEPQADMIGAVQTGDTATIDQLLRQDPGLIQIRDPSGRSLLHFAALYNQPASIHLLIDRGLDPSVRDMYGATPLAFLEESGARAEAARRALMERGGVS